MRVQIIWYDGNETAFSNVESVSAVGNRKAYRVRTSKGDILVPAPFVTTITKE